MSVLKAWVGVMALVSAGVLVAGCSDGGGGNNNGNGNGGDNDAGTASGDDGGATADDAATQDEPAPPACEYPQGPYGLVKGRVLPPGLHWQGYLIGATDVTTVDIHDLYDCDGTKGINAIVFDESATWCGACQQEAQEYPSIAQQYKDEGVQFLTLMVQDASQKPASISTATDWRDYFNLKDDLIVGADPTFTFAHAGTIGLPVNVLVDPRTMVITDYVEGYGGPDPAVIALAKKNGAP